MQSRGSTVPNRLYAESAYAGSHGMAKAQARSWVSRWEVALLLAICSLDMLSSVLLFHHRLAVEANPLLRPFAEADLALFAFAKLLTFVPALIAADWYAQRRPEFIQPLLRVAIAAYLGIYFFAVVTQLGG